MSLIQLHGDRRLLLPGQLIVSNASQSVWTLLGSCVAILFHNPRLRLSAVCHAMLASKTQKLTCEDTCPKPCGANRDDDDFKYVSCSFKYMLSQFLKLGSKKSDIEVSVFGGASMVALQNTSFRIGERNVNEALRLIEENHLTVLNKSVGGSKARTITFNLSTGEIKHEWRESASG